MTTERESRMFYGTKFASGCFPRNTIYGNSFVAAFALLRDSKRLSTTQRVEVHFTKIKWATRAARHANDICNTRLLARMIAVGYNPPTPYTCPTIKVFQPPLGNWQCGKISVSLCDPDHEHPNMETQVRASLDGFRLGFEHYETRVDAEKAALLLASGIWLMLDLYNSKVITEWPIPTPPQDSQEKTPVNGGDVDAVVAALSGEVEQPDTETDDNIFEEMWEPAEENVAVTPQETEPASDEDLPLTLTLTRILQNKGALQRELDQLREQKNGFFKRHDQYLEECRFAVENLQDRRQKALSELEEIDRFLDRAVKALDTLCAEITHSPELGYIQNQIDMLTSILAW